ncbi:hypothetical protein MRB53_040775 [Persea americana]|nr:hypothetical protein MRB53_040775 [Persea americana]
MFLAHGWICLIPTSFSPVLLDYSAEDEVWEFLDDCLIRASKKPVKYLDDLDHLQENLKRYQSEEGLGCCTLLPAVLLEQASFVVARTASLRDNQIRWVNGYFQVLSLATKGDAVVKK